MKRTSNRVMNLANFLRQTARRYPDRPALVWGEQRWTWRELDQRVDALGASLCDRGVTQGDRVVVQLRNGNALVETMFACFRIGAVFVPVNFRMTPEEVAYIAQASGARTMICDMEFSAHAACCKVGDTIFVGDPGGGGYAALVSPFLGQAAPEPAADYDDPCWLFYTSGTTGRPKAAVLTHGQMTFVILNHLCDLMPGLNADDASLVVAPLTHGAGVHILTQVARGAMSVLPVGERFDCAEAWSLIERWRVSNIFTVPTILKMLVEHPSMEAADHSSLRHVIYAGAPMYREDQKFALQKLGKILVQYYGLAEVTGAITVLRPEDHHAEDGEGVKIGTCGRERTGIQVSIQDETGQEVACGQTGEICVCGPAVFAGYFRNPEANAKAFRDGWFRTGDLGHLDAQGDLFITGRASDMYISGGSNVYPREIEEIILTHPAVDEVAIVGIPDPKWGEVGVAACVLHDGAALAEAELIDWLRERVAAYKLPRHVAFWSELPRSGYGKVTKVAVRELWFERRG